MQNYLRTLLCLGIGILALIGCGGPERGASRGATPKSTVGTDVGNVDKPGSEESGPVPFEEAKPYPCMAHSISSRFHSCFSAADGQCFHFGATCTPSQACLPSPSNEFRKCTNFSDGACSAWGASCEPKGLCVLDSQSGNYRSCEKSSKGSCAKFGALCIP